MKLLRQEKDAGHPSLKRWVLFSFCIGVFLVWLGVGLGIALGWWGWDTWRGWLQFGGGAFLSTGVLTYGAGKGAEAFGSRRSSRDMQPPRATGP